MNIEFNNIQNQNIECLKVKDKATGLEREIKAVAFNPALHEAIGSSYTKTRQQLIMQSRGVKIDEPVVIEKAVPAEAPEAGIEGMKFFELRALAKRKGFKVASTMKKPEILALLNGHTDA